MPYRGNPSTDNNDAVRLLIGDTSTGSEIFTDAEIDWFVSSKANVYLSAAAALQSILGSTRADAFGTAISSKKVGDLTISYQAGSAGGGYLTLRDKIKQLRMQGVRKVKPYAGGISEAGKDAQETDTDWNQPAFQVGFTDNPDTITGSTFR